MMHSYCIWSGLRQPIKDESTRFIQTNAVHEWRNGHVEVFQVADVGTSINERPRPLKNADTPDATHHTYSIECQEPINANIEMTSRRSDLRIAKAPNDAGKPLVKPPPPA